MWTPIEVVVDVREVGAQVAAARLLVAQGAGGDRRGQRIGVGDQLLEPAGVADRAGEAPDRVASRFGRRLEAPVGRVGAARGRDFADCGGRGALTEDEALAERVRGEAVGPVQACAGALADGEEARQRGAAVEVHRDSAHRVVGGRGDRHRLRAGVEPGLGERGEDVGEAGRVDAAQVERDVGRCRRARSGRGSPP